MIELEMQAGRAKKLRHRCRCYFCRSGPRKILVGSGLIFLGLRIKFQGGRNRKPAERLETGAWGKPKNQRELHSSPRWTKFNSSVTELKMRMA